VKWRTRDGRYTVELVRLALTGRQEDGAWIRLREWGYHVVDVRSPEDLVAYLDLADLEEALGAAA
jgi:hypothetical protein